MATNHTEHYQLNQWEATDRVLRTDFNEDNAKLDGALNLLEAGKGNCQILTGSYVGTGTYGSGNKNKIVFAQKPQLVFIAGDRVFWAMQGCGVGHAAWSNSGESIPVTWSGNTLSWYTENVNTQLNIKGTVYRYIALAAKE